MKQGVSFRGKVLFQTGLTVIVLIVLVIWGYSIMRALYQQNVMQEQMNAIGQTFRAIGLNHEILQTHVAHAVMEGDPSLLQRAANGQLCEYGKWYSNSKEQAKLEQLLPESAKEIFLKKQQMNAAHTELHEVIIQIRAFLLAGQVKQAKQLYTEVAVPRSNRFEQRWIEFNQVYDRAIELQSEQSNSRTSSSITLLLMIGLGIILVGLSLMVFNIFNILRPLAQALHVTKQLAAGAIPPAFDTHRDDEIGQLLAGLSALAVSNAEIADMAVRLSNGDLTADIHPRSENDALGRALSNMLQNIKDEITSLSEAIHVLNAATTEISASATQFVSSAGETAASVSETIAIMETVKEASQMSSVTARQVAGIATTAVEVSQTGQRSVDLTIEAMREIREQMKQIAQSIVRLSEHNRTIGEIITAVEEVAEQSNLLAVNASIEAANAGEQGKGFAVVAQEVKILAEQSKEATSQVRSILNDVQKATSLAVMTTDQGSKSVEAGVRQSIEAGDSIRKLAKAISEAAESVDQIASSAEQQLFGMDQIAQAMTNIEHATAYNLDSSRSLEEEAQNIENIGQRLKQMVARHQKN
ncbi:MAG: methyl-accepting chemotaxis protein [Solirubrobacterales bacterium]